MVSSVAGKILMYYYCLYMFVWFSTNKYAEDLKNSGNYGTNSGKICSYSGKWIRLKELHLFITKPETGHILSRDKFKTQDKPANTSDLQTLLHRLLPFALIIMLALRSFLSLFIKRKLLSWTSKPKHLWWRLQILCRP